MCVGAQRQTDTHTHTQGERMSEREREERESKVQEGLRFSGRRKYVRQNLILLNTMTQNIPKYGCKKKPFCAKDYSDFECRENVYA